LNIVDQSIVPLKEIDGDDILWTIEAACRLCYKSEGKNLERDPKKRDALIRAAVKRGHTSVLEHAAVTFRVICNRGVSHEWVRHRVGCSYSQESTRYCNYGDDRFGSEITVIWNEKKFGPRESGIIKDPEGYAIWTTALATAESKYLQLLAHGWGAEDARGILPNDLKTEMIVTMNPVSLRHFLTLRCNTDAHHQIRALAVKALSICHEKIPIIFDDLYERFAKE
jgi:thymidylate synthase (FAD)